MNIELNAKDSVELQDLLRECHEIARSYRENVGDEDSIVLEQDLIRLHELLGIQRPG